MSVQKVDHEGLLRSDRLFSPILRRQVIHSPFNPRIPPGSSALRSLTKLHLASFNPNPARISLSRSFGQPSVRRLLSPSLTAFTAAMACG